MKKILFTLFALVLASGIAAQIPEPDFIGEVLAIHSDGTAEKLEKHNVKMRTGAGVYIAGLAVNKSKTKILVAGSQANVRFAADEPVNLIVRAVDNKTDPMSIVRVFAMKNNRKQRSAVISAVGSFNVTSNDMEYLPFTAEKYGENSYYLTFGDAPAGEYGIIVTNPEFADVRSLEGTADTKNPCLPIIAVPTTAGTAAEVTINYVITDVEKKRKFVCVDPKDIPDIAVIDPDMMSTMPKGLTAATGMDALTHAIEGYITKGHCVISDMFHLEAIKLISQSLRGAVQNTPEGREGMALGQYIAGMGFSNVGLGIVHSMAHGLSALYDTPHGVACAILLPVGLEYNKSVAGERYRAVGKAMGVMGIDEMNDVEAADATIAAVKQLSADVGIPTNLNGILKEEDIQFLAESAYADACRPGNPRDTSVEEIVELYKSQL